MSEPLEWPESVGEYYDEIEREIEDGEFDNGSIHEITVIPSAGRIGSLIESIRETEGMVCSRNERLERLSESVRKGYIAGYIFKPVANKVLT